MKNIKHYLILSFVVISMMTSCIDDLNVQPNDPFITTSANVYTTTESYKAGLAKLYATFILTGQIGPAAPGGDITSPDVGGVDEGFSSFIRSLWYMQTLTTDEAVWSYPNDANGTISNLHFNSWLPTDGIPTALYARVANVAVLCNEYIRATEGKKEDVEIKRFRAEARFLRALSYYWGMDLFKNLPFVTEADNVGAYFPPMKKRAELYTYIETELLAIKPELGAPRFEYGRADKGVCAMLLAKLYMNADVYIGQKKYTEAITQLNEVIGGGYTLSPKYANLFLADNNRNNTEIIFAQSSDGARSQSYSMTWIMIYGNSGAGGWGGLRTTSALFRKFDGVGSTNAPATSPSEVNKARDLFLKEDKGQSLEIDAINQSKQGYGVWKFRNVNSDGTTPASASTGFNDTDYPMFRLADAYLLYAEAVLRGGAGGNRATALGYINAIRTRSGDLAASKAPGAITDSQLSLDFILDERARELYWEGYRRQDLIRFGKFTGDAYLWPWKGGIKNGTTIEAKRAFFPIPGADIASNPNLVQHDEYK